MSSQIVDTARAVPVAPIAILPGKNVSAPSIAPPGPPPLPVRVLDRIAQLMTKTGETAPFMLFLGKPRRVWYVFFVDPFAARKAYRKKYHWARFTDEHTANDFFQLAPGRPTATNEGSRTNG